MLHYINKCCFFQADLGLNFYPKHIGFLYLHKVSEGNSLLNVRKKVKNADMILWTVTCNSVFL